MSDNLLDKIRFNQQFLGVKGDQKNIKYFFNNYSH